MIDACCTHSHLVNSGVAGLNLIKFLHNVAKSLPFNRLKSKLRLSNPFRNVNMSNEGGSANFANFATKLVAIATSLELLQNERTPNEDLPRDYQSCKFGEDR